MPSRLKYIATYRGSKYVGRKQACSILKSVYETYIRPLIPLPKDPKGLMDRLASDFITNGLAAPKVQLRIIRERRGLRTTKSEYKLFIHNHGALLTSKPRRQAIPVAGPVRRMRFYDPNLPLREAVPAPDEPLFALGQFNIGQAVWGHAEEQP